MSANRSKILLFTLALTLTLSACGSTENDDTPSRETAAATAQNGSQQLVDGQGQQTTKQSESSDTAKDKLDEALGLKEQSPALSEDELKEKLEAEAGAAASKWYYDDYDGDGTKEAYAIIGGETITAVYAVDRDGNVSLMRDEFWGTNYNVNYDSLVEFKGKKYLAINTHNGGSGSVTYLFSVKNGKMQELAVSGELQGFTVEDGHAYTTYNDFSKGYHDWVQLELDYDSDSQEFAIEDKPVDSGEWKQAYIDYIDNTIAENFSDSSMFFEVSQFAIIDIDGDEVPEVFYDSGFGAGGSGLLTYADGEVSEIHGGNSSGIYYIEAGGIFKYNSGHMDSFTDDVYTISGGKPKLKLSGKYYLPDGAYTGTGDVQDYYEYYINDAQVPRGVYEKKLAAAFDQSSAKCALDGETYTYYDITSAIQGY
ncbi:hypothetical protein [Ruminococcus sp. 210702-SL.1.03]|uniref:hypothetical protein n=1 Tax=Ruminococcus sp. 210702-SL.1.03 TaxID=2883233 RepID=UPI001D090F0E|nr:hypothetical protein [Ruminococcus sp. 210702-SL.1.03]MCB6616368.1 hypothetical protein [Ruminococcus sp. 210702-SL.1.03]